MIDKIFPRKLNRSKDARLHDKTEMYDAINISVDDFDTSTDGLSDTGDAGVIKPVKGNSAVNQPFDVTETGNKRVLGSVADHVNNQLFVFVFSDNADEQGVYSVEGNELRVEYVSEYFQFLHDDFVKGDIIYQADGDRILYFTDGRNEPRRLPLVSDVSLPSGSASAAQKIDYITACPKTPMHPPTWEFFADPGKPINFRSVEGFQFAYQCIYSSGEETAISTYSDVAVPQPYLTQGSLTDPNLEAANGLRVSIPKIVSGIQNYTDNIEKIRLVVRIGNDGAFFTVAEKEVEDNLTFDFYNDSVLTGVPQEDQDKLNDALPRVARGQTIVNDRLIYGNYTEGYETNQVKASFSTVNTPRPQDFVDLKIGVRPLISPAFNEAAQNIELGLDGEDFTIEATNDSSKVFNRRASYQFDLSDLPNVLPAGALAEISFAIEPDGNFEMYNSDKSFHAFKNNGFGLSLDQPASSSVSDECVRIKDGAYSIDEGSPVRFQGNNGVGASNLTWTTTDPRDSSGQIPDDTEVQNIRFGTSPSNPFIIPQALVRFRARFRITTEVTGEGVKQFITDVLKGYFSDNNTDIQGADFSVAGNLDEALEGLSNITQGRAPTVSIDQFMDDNRGYGLIADNDKRARTAVSCFSGDEYVAPPRASALYRNGNAVGYFAVNKADVIFSLRHSQRVNDLVSSSLEYNVGPVFSLHVQEVSNVETVTMVPRITRSGSRGWIYFTKDFLENTDNQEAARLICLFDEPDVPNPEVSRIDDDYNIFFLSPHIGPITDNSIDVGGFDPGDDRIVREVRTTPTNFLNNNVLEILPSGQFTDTGLYVNRLTFQGFYGSTPVSTSEGTFLTVSERTELDSDYRVSGGVSQYGLSLTDEPVKRRHIGYLNLNDDDQIIRFADPNDTVTTVYSIVDGEAHARQNYEGGRLNPSYWYGIYHDTEYAGRNNDQFLLSEGSSSDTAVGITHGDFSYKSFDNEAAANKLDELIPDIESGRSSFALTTSSASSGAVGRSFKRNCSHSFALLYYDERGRPGEPVPLGSHFVSQIANPGLASIRLDIDASAPPPDWAHTYKVLYGGNNSISDFVQYTAGGAFTPQASGDENGVIYVSLNYLQQNNEVSYSKAFGAVRSDGDKDLYTYSEGDRLRIISYYNSESEVVYPQTNDPLEFQVIETVTLGDDPSTNPLTVEGDEVHPAKTGQFVIVKDNEAAQGFNFQDVANSGSAGQTTDEIYNPNNFWNRRCVFEIFSPQKKREVESRVYYEVGSSYNVIRVGEDGDPQHQTTSILIDQGDVYFRKLAVNMPDYSPVTNSFVGLIGNGTDTIDEATSPNFRSYHLESKTFTDIFPNADVLPYGKPRIALQKVQPIVNGNLVESKGSSNRYVRQSSLKFSDRSNANSNIVRYTSFNNSKLPFKDLQTNDGEIFYLVNYNDSIFCIQRLKCSAIPVARNILADALGNETVITTAQVLGTEKYYAGSYGTDVPESVAQADNAVYFVSVRQKEVYRFNPNSGIEVISEKGMASFFDTMISEAENSSAFKIVGGFDVDQQEYILSSTTDLQPIGAPEATPVFSNVVEEGEIVDDIGVAFDPVEPEEVPTDLEEAFDEINNLTDQLTALNAENDDQQNTITQLTNALEAIADLSDNLTFDADDIEGFVSAISVAIESGDGSGPVTVASARGFIETLDADTDTDNDGTADGEELFGALVREKNEDPAIEVYESVRTLFERGKISNPEAVAILRSLAKASGGGIVRFDTNEDAEVGTADLLEYLAVFGQGMSDEPYQAPDTLEDPTVIPGGTA